jgi:hypothetical protein
MIPADVEKFVARGSRQRDAGRRRVDGPLDVEHVFGPTRNRMQPIDSMCKAPISKERT